VRREHDGHGGEVRTADRPGGDGGAEGHHPLIGRPHREDEGEIARAEESAAALRTNDRPLGPPGTPLDSRSAFVRGATVTTAAVLVLSAAGLLWLVRDDLVLLVLALVLALGAEPVVSWLVGRGWRRGFAVAAVVAAGLAVVGVVLALLVPVLVDQAARIAAAAPAALEAARDPQTPLGRFTAGTGLVPALEQHLTGQGAAVLAGGLLSAGETLFSGLGSALVVVVLTVWFLVDLPRLRCTLYRLAPAPRRPRAVLLGDAVLLRVGGYVLGNVVVSVIAGGASFAVLALLGVPYAGLLAVVVAVLDLVPVVGSITAGVLASLVAFSVSPTVGWTVVGFFVVYRLVEDYLLVPAVIGRAVQVPALLTLLAVLLGGALYGVVGVLLAIPVASAGYLLVQEIVFPRLDRAGEVRPGEQRSGCA
jgi:predicted PurR-regulated permease PerM